MLSPRLKTCVVSILATVLNPFAAVAQASGPYPIQHVIMIMQENRSFDSYFGTFPGANGIPAGVCVPLDTRNPSKGCVAPFHDVHDANSGGPHAYQEAASDLDDGVTSAKMDGFVYQQSSGGSKCVGQSGGPDESGAKIQPLCTPGIHNGFARHDAMGYHTDAEIPNYWAYARNFVLQDNMFPGERGWSGDVHVEMTSEWTAHCSNPAVLSTCKSSHTPTTVSPNTPTPYPWVNLFQLMDTNNVSWKYYLASGPDPDCEDGQMTCNPTNQQQGSVASFWNPVPGYQWVNQQGPDYLSAHTPQLDQFLVDLKNGTLPQVSWIIPSFYFSEHPPNGVTTGMEYVTALVNAVMQSPYWQNTAIFISWDDWGGFYDHVPPPIFDYLKAPAIVQGTGIRVPGLLVSAYAKPGLIDHQVLSFDSYATFIEQLFMNGTHLDPVAMGQPDHRPSIRDALTTASYPDGSTTQLGQLINEFDFSQTPLPPLILSTHIPTGILATCDSKDKTTTDCTISTVKISWVGLAGGPVPGPFTYTVLRDGKPICTTTGTLCIDKTASSGPHFYTVYSVDGSNVASPTSAATEADVP